MTRTLYMKLNLTKKYILEVVSCAVTVHWGNVQCDHKWNRNARKQQKLNPWFSSKTIKSAVDSLPISKQLGFWIVPGMLWVPTDPHTTKRWVDDFFFWCFSVPAHLSEMIVDWSEASDLIDVFVAWYITLHHWTSMWHGTSPTSIIPAPQWKSTVSSLDRGHSQRAHRADVPVRSPRQCDVGAPCVSDCTLGLRCVHPNRLSSQEMVKTSLHVWHCTVIRNHWNSIYWALPKHCYSG